MHYPLLLNLFEHVQLAVRGVPWPHMLYLVAPTFDPWLRCCMGDDGFMLIDCRSNLNIINYSVSISITSYTVIELVSLYDLLKQNE